MGGGTSFKFNFRSKNYIRNTTRVLNSLESLDPVPNGRLVGPDLGPNYLQRLSAGVGHNSKERVNNDCWHLDKCNNLRDWLK